jgi:hypothetical protein
VISSRCRGDYENEALSVAAYIGAADKRKCRGETSCD